MGIWKDDRGSQGPQGAAGGEAIGFVKPHAAAAGSAGYIKCNGSAISRTTYAALFAVIGTVYGVGDGATTFNIPDLRGEFLRGFDDGAGVDSGRVFGSWQVDDFKTHLHNWIIATFASTGGLGLLSSVNRLFNPTINKSSSYAGGNETRPRNVAMSYWIKF